MTRQIIIAGLLLGLGLPAGAQMASTPNGQQPGASTPGTPPTFPTDRQETGKDRQNKNDSDADSQQTSRDSKDPDRDRQSQSDRDRLPQSDRDQQDQTNRDRQNTDRDRAMQNDRDNTDRDRDHHSDYQSQLQNAFQQQRDLANVQANFTDSSVELTGSVPREKDKHQARMMAQNYANGRKVIDHITVSERH